MQYPRDPGWKAPGTSRNATKAITGRAKTIRARVLRFLTQQHPSSFTADQIAAGLGESILSVRPRVSELHRSELIEPTAERWRAVRPTMTALVQGAPNERGGA